MLKCNHFQWADPDCLRKHFSVDLTASSWGPDIKLQGRRVLLPPWVPGRRQQEAADGGNRPSAVSTSEISQLPNPLVNPA